MPEPTEGPWSAPPCGAYGPVLGPNFEAIAFATTQPGDRWKAAANAHRMAAAPEMLEALEGVVRLTKVQHVLETWELGLLKAAIAKARGEK